MPLRSSFSSLLSYLLISLSLVGLAVFIGFYHPGFQTPRRYIELGAVTIAVFGTLMQAYWEYRRLPKLWMVLFVALAAHIAIFGYPFELYGYKWPFVLKTGICSGEVMLLMTLMYWLFDFIPYTAAGNK